MLKKYNAAKRLKTEKKSKMKVDKAKDTLDKLYREAFKEPCYDSERCLNKYRHTYDPEKDRRPSFDKGYEGDIESGGRRKTRRRRRKKHTRRRGKKGGHAGGRQYTYTELAAMREADEDRVYYLYIINTNSDPPLVAPVGNGFKHRLKENDNGDKIAITGHPINNDNSTAYTIPNPVYHTMTDPSVEDILNQFYNPAPGVSREFRDISDMMGNLQIGGRNRRGRRKKRTRRRRKSKRKSRRKSKRKSRRKRKR